MRTLFLVLSALFLTVSAPASATEPCRLPSEEIFQGYVGSSNLIIYAENLRSYTVGDKGYWTEIKVLETFRGTPDAEKFMVLKWASNNPPLFTYGEGDRFLLLFTSKDHGEFLTEDSWGECVPSVMPAVPSSEDSSEAEEKVLVNGTPMTLGQFREKYILKWLDEEN